MPFASKIKALEKVAGDMQDLGTPNTPMQQRLMAPVVANLKALVREEFRESKGPNGVEWQRTVRGRAALQSKKLAAAIAIASRDGSIVGVGKTKRDIIDAHNSGMTFQERQVAAQQQFLTFRNGKLIRSDRALDKKGNVRRGVEQIFARGHAVGERVLPQRQIFPDGTEMPPPWESAVENGLTTGMSDWAERTTK